MIRLQVIEGPEYQRDEDGWENYAYKVRLRRGTRSLTTKFHHGMALTYPPSAEEVLASLLMDSSVENYTSFEEWAEDYGYGADSRKAERIYNAVQAQTRKLRRFLGDDYDETSTEDAEDAAKRLVSA